MRELAVSAFAAVAPRSHEAGACRDRAGDGAAPGDAALAGSAVLQGVIKRLELDAWRVACP